jgi:hypothetical protein
MRGPSTIFQKLPKVNCHPMGEFSPNLVTLHLAFKPVLSDRVKGDQMSLRKISPKT